MNKEPDKEYIDKLVKLLKLAPREMACKRIDIITNEGDATVLRKALKYRDMLLDNEKSVGEMADTLGYTYSVVVMMRCMLRKVGFDVEDRRTKKYRAKR